MSNPKSKFISVSMPLKSSAQFTETELCEWLGAASPGDRVCYHRGFLAVECASRAGRLSRANPAELRRVAQRARYAANNGLVYLIQRRNGPADFEYLLVARHRGSSNKQASHAG
jgi:hypothetical protein